jgi:hypothetical protein
VVPNHALYQAKLRPDFAFARIAAARLAFLATRGAAGSRSLGCQTGAHYAVFKREGKYFLVPLDAI